MTGDAVLDIVVLAVLAPFVGSFLGVIAVRLPAGEGFAAGRSRCTDCGATLTPRDLVPILSWIWLKARCRSCGARLSAFYPAIELAALAVALWAATIASGGVLWASALLGWFLLTLTAIDWRWLLLPDLLTLPLIGLGLAAAVLIEGPVWIDHAIGAAVGFASFVAIAWVYRQVRRREGLGMGDAKLMAAAGAWVGWQGLPTVVLYAAVAGLAITAIMARRAGGLAAETRLPFGAYLCLGLWLVWLYGPLIPN